MGYIKRLQRIYIAQLLIGFSALIAGLCGLYPQDFGRDTLYGVAAGCLLTGGVGWWLNFRLLRNPARAAETELAAGEERNQFVRMKAFTAVFAVMFIVEGLSSVVTAYMGWQQVAITLCALLLIQCLAYWGFARYYSRIY